MRNRRRRGTHPAPGEHLKDKSMRLDTSEGREEST
jgi:hypothetical protein